MHPSTSFPAWPDVRRACETLLAEHGVLVVPGDCFGHPDRMRIGYGGPTGELAEGLARERLAVVEFIAGTGGASGVEQFRSRGA